LAQRLRNILRVNAATSMAAGLVMSIAPAAVDRILGTGHTAWIRVVGVGLVVFATDVAVAPRRERFDGAPPPTGPGHERSRRITRSQREHGGSP